MKKIIIHSSGILRIFTQHKNYVLMESLSLSSNSLIDIKKIPFENADTLAKSYCDILGYVVVLNSKV